MKAITSGLQGGPRGGAGPQRGAGLCRASGVCRIALGLALMAGLGVLPRAAPAQAAKSGEMPRLEKKNGRFGFLVDGEPYLVLGAQINNSSSWASTLPEVWPALKDLHANTFEAPVYWEQMEPQQGRFDFSNVDLLVQGARAHGLRLVLLWFGTWKNGQAHYVPEWVKGDPAKYPRVVSARGKLLDVMSAHAAVNREADSRAFAALMRHVKETDGAEHTVIMVQVENESGTIGAVRDHSAAADRAFAEKVPAAVTEAMHTRGGTWEQVFGADAEERFAAWSVASYINAVAQAGKAEYALPMYCNVWLTYPVHALENRDRPSPGQEYPSGGPQQGNIAIWKAAAPAIDILAPDIYSDDPAFYNQVLKTYARSDNALFVPETGLGEAYGKFFFSALGDGAIGFSPFGVDYTGWTLKGPELIKRHAENYALFAPMASVVAGLNFAGELQTAVEERGEPQQRLQFGDAEAVVSFGFPQRDGQAPPGTEDQHGRAMVAELGPLEFLVTGVDASVSFVPGGKTAGQQLEILRADEGKYVNGQWQTERIWNGDQTDRGLNFHDGNTAVVRILLHTLPMQVGSAGGK